MLRRFNVVRFPCCSVSMLFGFHVVQFQCCSVSMLVSFNVVRFPCWSVSVLCGFHGNIKIHNNRRTTVPKLLGREIVMAGLPVYKELNIFVEKEV